uniref:PPPDE domain-containing protein n=1 Tax=Alexandrium monilatum TaxID=311494 RepID=A0A7S4Q6V0_9DINO|mmetsp:Transcript_38200/g.118835  ORF Transcript_38200/g.118835 Transcript_38200/m.118835 type:complete len:256 (+) Transcript_38200:65-832(+)
MGNAAMCREDRKHRPSGFSQCAPHEVRLAATEILRVAGFSGYHTSVIVDDREYFFDSKGMMAAPPLSSHAIGQDRFPKLQTEVIEIGRSSCSGKALVGALQPLFENGSYDIFLKNCNSFSDISLYYLTRTRLPGQYNRLERFVSATSPVSTGVLNKIFRVLMERKTGKPCVEDVYVRNPEAESYSAEGAIASLDGDASESDSQASDFEEHFAPRADSFSLVGWNGDVSESDSEASEPPSYSPFEAPPPRRSASLT